MLRLLADARELPLRHLAMLVSTLKLTRRGVLYPMGFGQQRGLLLTFRRPFGSVRVDGVGPARACAALPVSTLKLAARGQELGVWWPAGELDPGTVGA